MNKTESYYLKWNVWAIKIVMTIRITICYYKTNGVLKYSYFLFTYKLLANTGIKIIIRSRWLII